MNGIPKPNAVIAEKIAEVEALEKELSDIVEREQRFCPHDIVVERPCRYDTFGTTGNIRICPRCGLEDQTGGPFRRFDHLPEHEDRLIVKEGPRDNALAFRVRGSVIRKAGD